MTFGFWRLYINNIKAYTMYIAASPQMYFLDLASPTAQGLCFHKGGMAFFGFQRVDRHF